MFDWKITHPHKIGAGRDLPSKRQMSPRKGGLTHVSGPFQRMDFILTLFQLEGRLVLADILWYAQEQFKPKAIVYLATLTGAIRISLGRAVSPTTKPWWIH